ncbi:hypothetical protein HMPREF0971_00091 [Segatella oris F0302]|uniref:Lipoprotein n=1 Tax=Segatella oris F0302 TaxID=649760 RepID=D1QMT3_9BACT|nr:hypothetical protein [Segatella oris]EFB33332.1 hypothetical protein HMPREF0971_00091 [Segatella oris F0302]MBF1449762.1 hypothetical protein [Segatella oris]
MKKILFSALVLLTFTACHHETIEERAAREAKEYTQKMCPTPVVNFTRTDSMVFDKTTRTLIYFCSFTDKMDNAEIVNANRTKLSDGLREGLLNDTGLKTYREAGFHFKYIVRSAKDPKKTLYQEKF